MGLLRGTCALAVDVFLGGLSGNPLHPVFSGGPHVGRGVDVIPAFDTDALREVIQGKLDWWGGTKCFSRGCSGVFSFMGCGFEWPCGDIMLIRFQDSKVYLLMRDFLP